MLVESYQYRFVSESARADNEAALRRVLGISCNRYAQVLGKPPIVAGQMSAQQLWERLTILERAYRTECRDRELATAREAYEQMRSLDVGYDPQ